jgi:hypothetical protein
VRDNVPQFFSKKPEKTFGDKNLRGRPFFLVCIGCLYACRITGAARQSS